MSLFLIFPHVRTTILIKAYVACHNFFKQMSHVTFTHVPLSNFRNGHVGLSILGVSTQKEGGGEGGGQGRCWEEEEEEGDWGKQTVPL